MANILTRNGLSLFLGCKRAAVAPIVALSILTLIIVTGIAVDTGRLYAVRANGQDALDAATLATSIIAGQTEDTEAEFLSFFNANYNTTYMGGNVTAFTFEETPADSGIFVATVDIQVPTVIMDVISARLSTVRLSAEVTRGLQTERRRRLALTLALDNTGSMAGTKIVALRNASRDLINIVFGGQETVANIVSVSIVPYHVAVNLTGFANQLDWIQEPFRPFHVGFASNRNFDAPRDAKSDLTDAPPTDNNTRFRTSLDRNSGGQPILLPSPPNPAIIQAGGGRRGVRATCADWPDPTLRPVRFGMTNRTAINAELALQTASGCTRVNVGALWGWMTLSPRWQGVWDPARPALPQSIDALLDRTLVIMTDGENTAFMGQPPANATNDDIELRNLCTAIRADGVRIYTVGFGPTVNSTLLRDCAGDASRYFFAPNETELRRAFQAIGDDILFNTIRLSH